MNKKTATIKIEPETRELLKSLGDKGQSYDDVIRDLADGYKLYWSMQEGHDKVMQELRARRIKEAIARLGKHELKCKNDSVRNQVNPLAWNCFTCEHDAECSILEADMDLLEPHHRGRSRNCKIDCKLGIPPEWADSGIIVTKSDEPSGHVPDEAKENDP
jgi:predicted CopG family antitoxin